MLAGPGVVRPENPEVTNLLTCDDVADRAFVERYLSHRLAPAEEEAFESHYLTCDACQREIRLGVAIRSELRNEPKAVPHVRSRFRVWAAGGSVAIAAGLAAILLIRVDRTPANVARLGAVSQAPVYGGIPVRGETSSTDSLFANAMTQYAAGRYDRAEAGLNAALKAGVDRPPAEFFLGASLLLLNQPRKATDSFGRVIELGETVYLTEAYYLRAKALLQLGRTNEALDDLVRAARRPDETAAHAAALADSVKDAIQR
jgi:tetratricopeptide (TPR) repeat protein